MISKIAFVMMAVLLSASAFASDNLSRKFQGQPAGEKFPARETTFDVFGTWRVAEHRDFSDGKLGFGIGADYFFNRYVGLSSDTHLEHFGFPQHVNFSIIGRYPIEKWSLAPYLMFGGGRHFRDPSEWTLHFGRSEEHTSELQSRLH